MPGILSWKSHCLSALTIPCPSVLAWSFCGKICPWSWGRPLVYNTLYLAAFESLALPFTFGTLVYMSRCGFLWVFLVWNSLDFLKSYVLNPPGWGHFQPLFPQEVFCPFLFSPPGASIMWVPAFFVVSDEPLKLLSFLPSSHGHPHSAGL